MAPVGKLVVQKRQNKDAKAGEIKSVFTFNIEFFRKKMEIIRARPKKLIWSWI